MGQSDRERQATKLIGKQLRAARSAVGVTQAVLGEACGCTFQQIQKYERGKNRISAGKLVVAAEFLDVPVGFFFETAAEATPGVSRKHLQLMRALVSLEARSQAEFQAIYDLAMTLAGK